MKFRFFHHSVSENDIFIIGISLIQQSKSYFDVPDLRRNSLETSVLHKLPQKPVGNSLEKLSVLAL